MKFLLEQYATVLLRSIAVECIERNKCSFSLHFIFVVVVVWDFYGHILEIKRLFSTFHGSGRFQNQFNWNYLNWTNICYILIYLFVKEPQTMGLQTIFFFEAFHFFSYKKKPIKIDNIYFKILRFFVISSVFSIFSICLMVVWSNQQLLGGWLCLVLLCLPFAWHLLFLVWFQWQSYRFPLDLHWILEYTA